MDGFARSLDSRYVLTLDTVDATLVQQNRRNNNFTGTLYVATPQLLATYGVKDVNPGADILTMRPGLDAVPRMQLLYGELANPQANPSAADNPVIPRSAACRPAPRRRTPSSPPTPSEVRPA